MSPAVFNLEDVHFSYLNKFPALCGISLEIAPGEMVVLLGANGSGKSSLLHMLDALIFPDQGKISFYGKELNEGAFLDEKFARGFRSRVGLVFQNSEVQLFCPTVEEDILFGPLQLGVGKGEIERRFDTLVSSLGLKGLLSRAPYQLSAGEKRKVAIASTLIMEPEVLILDEPTAGLDPATVRVILDAITRAHEEGRTVITATHDLHIVEEVAQKACILSQERKVVCCGRAADILSDRQLLEAHNLVHIHSHKHKDKVHIHPHEHIEHHHGE